MNIIENSAAVAKVGEAVNLADCPTAPPWSLSQDLVGAPGGLRGAGADAARRPEAAARIVGAKNSRRRRVGLQGTPIFIGGLCSHRLLQGERRGRDGGAPLLLRSMSSRETRNVPGLA